MTRRPEHPRADEIRDSVDLDLLRRRVLAARDAEREEGFQFGLAIADDLGLDDYRELAGRNWDPDSVWNYLHDQDYAVDEFRDGEQAHGIAEALRVTWEEVTATLDA
jgi:hypothetical protein